MRVLSVLAGDAQRVVAAGVYDAQRRVEQSCAGLLCALWPKNSIDVLREL